MTPSVSKHTRNRFSRAAVELNGPMAIFGLFYGALLAPFPLGDILIHKNIRNRRTRLNNDIMVFGVEIAS